MIVRADIRWTVVLTLLQLHPSTSWIASKAVSSLTIPGVSLHDCVKIADGGKQIHLCKQVTQGQPVLSFLDNSFLTATAAYEDMDVGLALRKLAPKIGPGFESVALATLLSAEYIRNFETRPSAFMPEGGDSKFFTELIPSRWGLLAQSLWEDADQATTGKYLDADLEPLANMGVGLMVPILSDTNRRAWCSGTEGRLTSELEQIAHAAFCLVLHHQRFPEGGKQSEPVLFPPLREEEEDKAAVGNVVLHWDGDLGLKCVAACNLVKGEAVSIA